MYLWIGLISKQFAASSQVCSTKGARWPADGKLRDSHHGKKITLARLLLIALSHSSKSRHTHTHSADCTSLSLSSGCTLDPEGIQGNIHSHSPPPTLSPVAADCGGGCLTRCHTRFIWLTTGCSGRKRTFGERSVFLGSRTRVPSLWNNKDKMHLFYHQLGLDLLCWWRSSVEDLWLYILRNGI